MSIPVKGTAEDLLGKGGLLELVGRTEAAEIIGCSRTNLQYHPDLPEPVITYLSAGDFWLRGDIEVYASRRDAKKAKRKAVPADG